MHTASRETDSLTTLPASTVRSLAHMPARVVEEVVNTICAHASVARAVTTDQRAPGFISHPCVDYLGAFVGQDLVGVFMTVEASDIERDVHALLLPQALKHSRDLGAACLHWVFNDPAVQRVTAYVSSARPSTINFCRRLGFVQEGVRRHAETRAGQPHDVHVLGITRREWKGL
jgi:hypothetical protein